MRIWNTMTSSWKLPWARKTFISADGSCFRTYVMDALGSVREFYVGQGFNESHVELLEVAAEM